MMIHDVNYDSVTGNRDVFYEIKQCACDGAIKNNRLAFDCVL